MSPFLRHDSSLIRAICAVCITVLLITSGCVPAFNRIEPENLVWPLPPNPPRIKYIQSIYEEDDIGRVYSFKEKLFGKEYYDTIARPYGVSSRGGQLLVTDLGRKVVFKFNLREKRLSFLGGDGTLQVPTSAAADAAGNCYVADAGDSKIVVYDAGGAYKTQYPLGGGRPVALAVHDALGRLYVLDRSGHQVSVLGLDGSRLFAFGGQGDDDGQFNIPLSIALDTKGRIYVLDSGNFRIQIFDAEGNFISKFGQVGDRSGMFANPKGIAVDSEGHIYVTDAAFSNFQIFDDQGRFLLFVGNLGPLPGQLHLPGGIGIDENDRIYVADQFNRRVQVFQYLKQSLSEAIP